MLLSLKDIDLSKLSEFFPVDFEKLKEWFSYSTTKPWFFTEFSFLGVFGVFLIIYSVLAKANTLRKVYIIVFSLFFYYKSSGPFLGLFVLMILSAYLFALAIHKSNGWLKKLLLWLSVSYSLSFLLYFKYANFFIENFNAFLHTNFELQNLFLPIGISFYTFQSVSYIVDVYRKEIPPSRNFTDYAFYMTFFPHLVAGPIVRAKDFLPQIVSPEIITSKLFKESMLRIITGLLKKLFLADYLAKYVDLVHMSPSGFSGAENLLSMYAYAFQIYFDFSGYSDIAIGIALLLGYRLKENFQNPYTAVNITEFWRKWHISLSNWLRDYVYIPLGGNRKGLINTYLFLLITMLIGGFWHGADWRFVFWGLAHGLALILHKIWKHFFPKEARKWFVRIPLILITFHFVGFCWIFFRATSFSNAFISIQQIFLNTQPRDFIGFWFSRPEISSVLTIAFAILVIPVKVKEYLFSKIQLLPAITWIIWIIIALQIIVQFKDDVVQPFIYFQF